MYAKLVTGLFRLVDDKSGILGIQRPGLGDQNILAGTQAGCGDFGVHMAVRQDNDILHVGGEKRLTALERLAVVAIVRENIGKGFRAVGDQIIGADDLKLGMAEQNRGVQLAGISAAADDSGFDTTHGNSPFYFQL